MPVGFTAAFDSSSWGIGWESIYECLTGLDPRAMQVPDFICPQSTGLDSSRNSAICVVPWHILKAPEPIADGQGQSLTYSINPTLSNVWFDMMHSVFTEAIMTKEPTLHGIASYINALDVVRSQTPFAQSLIVSSSFLIVQLVR